MRILYLTSFFHHPLLGGSQRHYFFARELAKRHEVVLLSCARGPVPVEALADVASFATEVGVFEERPRNGSRIARLRAAKQAREQLMADVRRRVGSDTFDVAVVHGDVLAPVLECLGPVPPVYDLCDATSMRLLGSLRYGSRLKAPAYASGYLQLRRLEQRLVRSVEYHSFISPRDRDAVEQASPRSAIIPNGIDVDYWTPAHDEAPVTPRVVFTGVMRYAPNVDAALQLIDLVLPRLAERIPDVELAIVGREPKQRLLDRAATPGVTVTGSVDDMRPYLDSSTVFAAPIRFGAGMQNKVLEAMAMELPVVATSLVADGLRLEDGTAPPIVVADGPDEFAAAVAELTASPDRCRALGRSGRAYVAEHFDWTGSAAKLEELCIAAARGAKEREDAPGRPAASRGTGFRGSSTTSHSIM